MNNPYALIIQPKENRYKNTKKVSDKNLILNTSISDHRYVSKEATVKALPGAFKTPLRESDEVLVHHNIFRRYYDVRGNEKNSGNYFKEDMYFCYYDQIFLYKQNNEWKAPLNYCFVKPILNNKKDIITTEKERKHIGVLKYGNKSLEALGINEGDLIGFNLNSEYEFVIDNNRLYRMQSKDITIKYEYKGDEVEYNPSWAKGCGRTY